MKRTATILLALTLCVPTWAKGHSHKSTHHKATHSRTHSGEKATATCNDGTASYSHHHRGTCSHHGGVGEWK